MIDGTVVDKGFNDSFGYFVHVKISNNCYLSYNHLNKILVDVGDKVKSGQIIAKSGNTGSSTGPHLHLSLFYKDKAIDVLSFVKYEYTQNFIDEYTYRGVSFNYEN